MYPMVKFPALALYTLLHSVEILSSKGENNRMMVCSLIYMYDCLKICKVCIESRQCLAPSSDGAKIDSQQEVAALFLCICIICGMQIFIVDFDVQVPGLYRNVCPVASTATYRFSRLSTVYMLLVVSCAIGMVCK